MHRFLLFAGVGVLILGDIICITPIVEAFLATWRNQRQCCGYQRSIQTHHLKRPLDLLPTTKTSVQDHSLNMESSRIDNLITNMMFTEEEEEGKASIASFLGASVFVASNGLRVWRHALSKGRLPTEEEFLLNNYHTTSSSLRSICFWPPMPLYSYVYNAMVELQLPRLALSRPQIIPLILRSVLRTTVDFYQQLDVVEKEKSNNREEKSEDDSDDDETFGYEYYDEDTSYWYEKRKLSGDDWIDLDLNEKGEPDSIAQDVAESFLKQWSPVLIGVRILDSLYGDDHDLLQTDIDDDVMTPVSAGFGFTDGIWTHTGWKIIPELQRELAQFPELVKLIRNLGRCPTTEKSERTDKFTPRTADSEGALGAEFESRLRESVSGIARSASLTEMLPSEAVLLRGSSSALRYLFLAKWAESKLLSYELSGYMDIPSVPRTRALYQSRLPSAPGGPIIVCLDTSWSMLGARETLSKAVVLACVMQAHQQGRQCQIVAFSAKHNVIDSGVISPDPEGVRRLLSFLSSSFGGGTDVTGALKFAISSLSNDTETGVTMSAADILLVTDGEIPNPPVPDDIMGALDRLILKKGLEVHGLLVGKSESKPLARLCTHTHNFLTGFQMRYSGEKGMSQRQINHRDGRMNTALYVAKRSIYDEDEAVEKRILNRKIKKKWDDDDMIDISSVSATGDQVISSATFPAVAQEYAELLMELASQIWKEKQWTSQALQQEREQHENLCDMRTQLRSAVSQVEEGLVERGEDARLVVLALIAGEHVLLLGSPGTAKSVLGLRLAKLCDGSFFQRLLTRFTTPEELFGPLSLRSLEQDEYRRVTAGFLPTADVAFLDEIFKSNSAILNTLLTILNERKFDNAGMRESCPIRCVVGASNELPDSDELVALFDRFLIRKKVIPVSDDGILKLLSMSNPGESSLNGDHDAMDDVGVSFSENLDGIVNSLSAAVESVIMDTDACELMRDFRTYLREKVDITISDRRIVKTARLMKICAATDGRRKVDMIDFLLTQHCFWNDPEQRSAVREWLWENLTPMDQNRGTSVSQLRFLLNNLRQEILSAIQKTNGHVDSKQGAKSQDIARIDQLREEVDLLAVIIQDHQNRLARHLALLKSFDIIWFDSDDVKAIQQLLLPKGELLWPKVKALTEDVYALSLAISTTVDGSPPSEIRQNVIQMLWDDDSESARDFTTEELEVSTKEAKAQYDQDTFRRWKRAKKKAEKGVS